MPDEGAHFGAQRHANYANEDFKFFVTHLS